MKKQNRVLTLGQRLSKLREKKKLSLEELSAQTGLKTSHLERIEEGKEFAPVGDILKISKVLTVDLNIFLKAEADREQDLKKQRIRAFKKRESSYQYHVLTPEARNKHIRAFRVSIAPRSEPEPVNNFWTLPVRNYCSIFLSPNASAGGLIHAAPGKAGGNGTPLTNRSGWASKATSSTFFLDSTTSFASP